MTRPVPAPEISVVVPARQAEATVGRAVASILAQDGPELEVIVVDDGSTDGTGQAVAAWEDLRLRYERQDHRGVSAARNRGVELSRGPLLAFLDSDDEALPGWLSALYRELQDPEVGAVCCGLWIHRGGRDTSLLPRPRGAEFAFQTVEFLAGSFGVRRDVFEAVGGYAEELAYSENTELGFRLASHCEEHGLRLAAVAEPLVRYHAPTGDTRSLSREAVEARLAASRYILHRHGEILGRNPVAHADFLATAGVRAARLGCYREARTLWRHAAAVRPTDWRHHARLAALRLPPLARRLWRPLPPAGAGSGP